MFDFPSFDSGFQLMSALFPIFFIVIAGAIIAAVIAGIARWSKNNRAPVLIVPAKITNMRTDVSHHHHGGDPMSHSSSTWYYATFEVESGNRMELSVSASDYGSLALGDVGRLTFQGTRYMGFAREK